ncbi:hypothetical protein [Accumulibacter sp.]|uniref:hypothetical protein n=1 Tax=Accumulibacter sp. TaxID=2053492 RepID=UPI00258320F9|nr:hypothetical protein [Accumulibacter sp.]
MVATNMDPNQYTAADGTKNARWEQTQAYIDAQNRLQADKLRVAEMQAVRQGMNPVQAAAATQGMAQAAQKAQLDRQVVQQQIETGKVAAQNSKELQDLYAAHRGSKQTTGKTRGARKPGIACTGKASRKRRPSNRITSSNEYGPDGSGMSDSRAHRNSFKNPGATPAPQRRYQQTK